MAITIPALIMLVAAFALPNFLAIRLGVFGGGTLAAAPEVPRPVPAVPVAGAAPAAKIKQRRLPARLTRGGYLWKALSPMLFAVGLIMGIAVGGPIGIALAVGTLLNMLWGFLGWEYNLVGKRHY